MGCYLQVSHLVMFWMSMEGDPSSYRWGNYYPEGRINLHGSRARCGDTAGDSKAEPVSPDTSPQPLPVQKLPQVQGLHSAWL